MKTRLHKLSFGFFTILLMSFIGNGFGQTEIFNEEGGGAAPTGWTFENNITTNDIDRTSYWLVDAGANSDRIITATYDLSAFTEAEFSISVATFNNGGNNPALIEISFDGGVNYTQSIETATPTSSTYIDGGNIILNSISSQVVIRISNSGTSGRGVRLKNLILTADGVASNVDNPQAFSATTSSTSQIDLAATANANTDDVLVAFNTTDTFGAPTGTYNNGDMITGGGTVLHMGSAGTLPNHTGLNSATTYFYKAWSYDGVEYSTGVTDNAITLCDTFSIPFTEGFESGVPPVCWTSFIGDNGAGVNENWKSDSDSNTGSFAAIVEDENSGALNEDWLVTPLITLTSDTQLRFFEKQLLATDYMTDYRIKVSTTSQTDKSSFVDIDTYSEDSFSNTDYQERIISLSAFDGQSVYIAFVISSEFDDGWLIDDVSIIERVNESPEIMNIVETPSGTVTTQETVSVSADVTDDVSGFTTVLKWGTATGVYNNTITMTAPMNSDTYTTDSDIPMQSDGVTVYYVIEVTDSDSLVVTSTEQSYIVANNAPEIANILHTPDPVTDADPVNVSATITDDSDMAPNLTAVLNWGTTSGSVNLTNQISMTASGDTFSTSTAIPSQDVGTTIYYEIVATDNEALSSTSVEQSYTVVEPPMGAIDLFFSEYVEGGIGNNKYLEIYNGTGLTVNLSNYSVELYSNGSLTANNTEDFSGLEFPETLANEQTIVLMNSASDIYSGEAFNTTVCNFNGNDAIALLKNGVIIDIIGEIGSDPGSEWGTGLNSTADNTIVRNSDICQGNASNEPGFPSLATEWTGFNDGNVDNLGSHTANCGMPAPLADYVYLDNTTGWVPNDPSDAGNPSDATNSVLVQSGTATTAADFSADTVTIDSGATLNAQGVTVVTGITNSGAVTISGVLVAPSATIITGNDFTFKNTSMSTGVVGLTSAATFTGNVTVERYIPQSNRAYRLLASPVKNAGTINANWQEAQPAMDNGFGIHITGSGGASNGFDATTTNNPSMYIVNEQADPAAYVAVTSTNMGDGSAEEDGVLKHGIGYLTLVRGNRSTDLTNNEATLSDVTLRTTGEVHTGDFVVAASNLNPNDDGSILVGNPYQAPVDMDAVLNNAGTVDVQTDAYHVYDPTLGDKGAFVTVTFSTLLANDINSLSFPLSDTGAMASNSAANRYLQPGQSAFVNTDNPIVGTPEPALTFMETNKVTEEVNTDIFFTSNTTTDKFISIALYDTESFTNNNTPRDGSFIRFNENYNSSFDNLDASKAGNLDENLGSLSEGNLLSINSMALPIEGDEISLSISNYKKTDYTLQLRLSDFENTSAYLVDSYLGTQTLLTNSGETLIQFSVDDSEPQSLSEDRFEIIFTQNVLGVDTFNDSLITVYPNPVTDGELTLSMVNGNFNGAEIKIFNMLGQNVLSKAVKTSTQQSTINTQNLNSGVYIVTVSTEGNMISKRIIIK